MESIFFFFNDTATTEIYALSLHDALPIWGTRTPTVRPARTRTTAPAWPWRRTRQRGCGCRMRRVRSRSEEHTSELQSRQYLVCRLLLEKKKTAIPSYHAPCKAC